MKQNPFAKRRRKLSPAIAKTIVTRYCVPNGPAMASLAATYNVSEGTISKVINGLLYGNSTRTLRERALAIEVARRVAAAGDDATDLVTCEAAFDALRRMAATQPGTPLSPAQEVHRVQLWQTIYQAAARTVTRGPEAVEHVDALPNGLKVEHNMRLAQLGVLGYFANERQAPKPARKVAETSRVLPLQQCLDKMKATL